MNFSNLFWRFRFMLAVVWIFRDFEGWPFVLGWEVSGVTEYRHLSPYKAAIAEITEWYE